VEVGTREHHARAVLREPACIGAVDVVDRSSRRDARAHAAERSEERREIGCQSGSRIAVRAEEREPAPDDVVEATARLAAADLALEEEVAGQRVAVGQQAGAERGRRQRRRGAAVLHGGDHRGIARGGRGGVRDADHLAELDRELDHLTDLGDALGRVGVEQRIGSLVAQH